MLSNLYERPSPNAARKRPSSTHAEPRHSAVAPRAGNDHFATQQSIPDSVDNEEAVSTFPKQ